MKPKLSFHSRRAALPVLLLTIILMANNAQAQQAVPAVLPSVPQGPEAAGPQLQFQGRLLDPVTGQPKPDGTYKMIFSIYDSVGTQLWYEKPTVDVRGGLYNVYLGSQVGLGTVFDSGADRWLGIAVGGDAEAVPRIQIGHVPYAMQTDLAANSLLLNGQTASSYAAAVHAHSAADITSGTLSTSVYSAYADLAADSRIGLAASQVAAGDHNHDATYVNATGDMMTGVLAVSIPAGGSHGVSSITASTAPGAAGVEAKNTGAGYGLNAYSASNYGVIAITGATGPGRAAVRGLIGAASGASPAQEAGVWGEAAEGYGLAGQSTNSYGVWAYSANSYGLYAAANGTNPAIYALNSNASGGVGVWGQSNRSRGVYAQGYDVGAYGYGTNGYGLYGYSSATTSGYAGVGGHAAGTSGAVYGIKGSCNTAANASCLAGYFAGPVYVSGMLTKAGGGFKIDHPIDPQNQYLYHSFVESPDMKNIYDGSLVLDAEGKAWVELPDWFEALNRDFRYQLTAVGGPGPNLFIAQKIQNNRFQIAGGTSGLEVSWQVTGIRRDAYANAHRIPVEEDKSAEQQGTYLNPDAFGQPESLGANLELPLPVPPNEEAAAANSNQP